VAGAIPDVLPGSALVSPLESLSNSDIIGSPIFIFGSTPHRIDRACLSGCAQDIEVAAPSVFHESEHFRLIKLHDSFDEIAQLPSQRIVSMKNISF